MLTAMTTEEQIRYLKRQLEALFPDNRPLDNLDKAVPTALERLEYCFSKIRLSPYSDGGQPKFNYLHSDQYATFLYYVSNTAWRDYGNVELASKVFGLNKSLNGLVCMYDTILPDVVLLIHSVGIVLGKASYSDNLVVCQNVTVGTDRGKAPVFDGGVVLFGGSTIIGETSIGSGVSVAAGATIRSETIPNNSVVAGVSPNLIVKQAKRSLAAEYFYLPEAAS